MSCLRDSELNSAADIIENEYTDGGYTHDTGSELYILCSSTKSWSLDGSKMDVKSNS